MVSIYKHISQAFKGITHSLFSLNFYSTNKPTRKPKNTFNKRVFKKLWYILFRKNKNPQITAAYYVHLIFDWANFKVNYYCLMTNSKFISRLAKLKLHNRYCGSIFGLL